MKKIFTSIFQDLKSWDKILINRWHLHSPIAFVIGYLMYQLIGNSISDIYIFSEMLLKTFVPSFLGFIGLWGFEAWQKRGRIIGEIETFESDKDLWVGEFFLILGVILNHII
jgi:hypothetical protein